MITTMRSFLLMIVTIFFMVNDMTAQSFEKGQKDINLGLGLGNILINPTNAHNIIPPVTGSFDYGITDAISIGGQISYAGARWSYSGSEWCNYGIGKGNYYKNYNNYTDTYTWSFYIIGARAAYHFAQLINIDNLDVYAGVMTGYNIARYNFSTTSVCSDHTMSNLATYGGFVGGVYGAARYRFTDNFGAFAEVGYGIVFLNTGLNFKF